MRNLNTFVRVPNKYIGEQFDIINSENLKERYSYGIVSKEKPNKKDSPLATNILIQRVVLDVVSKDSYTHNADYIEFGVVGNSRKIILKESDTYYSEITETTQTESWKYYSTVAETINSIVTALNKVAGVSVYLSDAGLILYGISSDVDFKVYTVNESLSYIQDINIDINGGTVVFPNKNAVAIASSSIKFPYDYLQTNDIYRLCLRYSLVDGELVENEFGEDIVKSRVVSTSLEIENIDDQIDDKDSVCLCVIKSYNGSIHFVDTDGHLYPYNRPWFSPEDVNHRSMLGTARVTEHNPHGIDFDDIDSDNTLHNRLLKDGAIISQPDSIQDVTGTLITETIKGSSILADTDGTYSQYDLPGHPTRYYKLRYTPTTIHKIVRHVVSNGVTTDEEIYLKNIEGTAYLLCSTEVNGDIVSVSDDIIVTYSCSVTAQSTIQKTQGILISPINGNDIILSEGKNVRLYESTIDIFHKTNINRYFFVNMTKDGNLETTPSVISNNALEVESGDTNDVRERSRLAVFLYNTNCKSNLEAPSNAVIYSANKEFELFKTNVSYSNNKVYLDSYTSPKENIFKENDDSEWITIDTSKDNSRHLHCYRDIVKKDNAGEGYGQWYLNINLKENKITHVKGYVVLTSTTGNTNVSLNAGNKELFAESSKDTNVTFIKIDKDISLIDRVLTGNYVLRISSVGTFYVKDIYLEFDYDEVSCRYFIQQKEGEKTVTRLLYDSHKIYPSDIVTVEGSLVKIKRASIVYDEIPKGETINPIFEETYIKSNADFDVEITVYGEADGKAVSESIKFDDTFREQPEFNYRILNNAFTSISKYTIDNTTTIGNILLLAYPLSNYLNSLRLVYASYSDSGLKDYKDIRKCISTIQNMQDNCLELFGNSCEIL